MRGRHQWLGTTHSPEMRKHGSSHLAAHRVYPPFREGVLKYYKDYCITWWGGSCGPTDSPISSQVACINHLEPARLNHEVAIQLARKHIRDAAEVLPIEGGFLAYEWVGDEILPKGTRLVT